MVLRRSFYELNGGFLLPLVHVADWEMWLRCITLGGGLFINWPLACYRSFKGNDTGRLAKTGENVRDYLRLFAILSAKIPDLDHQRFLGVVASVALYQKNSFEASRDAEAARANQAIWEELVPPTSLPTRVRLLASAVKSVLQKR